MARNQRMRSWFPPIKWIEAWFNRKKQRRVVERKQPLDAVFGMTSTTESSKPIDGFVARPQTPVVSIPLSTHNEIYQMGLLHQGGDETNLGEMSGFEEGDEILGVDGGDCLRVIADMEGLHKWGVSTLMLDDDGQFSVWVYGKGESSTRDYDYVLSVHQHTVEATPIDEETLVIRWENPAYFTPPDIAPTSLRLYPDLTHFPGTYVEIPLPEVDWQDAGWHKITATWSYQNQLWTLKWDDTEGTLTNPGTVLWPHWDEFTQADIFTDLNFEKPIFHYVCHIVFGPITDPACVTGEPTGFPNRTDSTLTFTNGTRLFEIDPVGDNFTYYINCQLYRTNGDNITITDVEGLHYIYYNGAMLSESVNPSNTTIETIFINYALVSIIYWDATNNLGIYVGEERHGLIMDGDTHVDLHFSRGLQWVGGLALNTIDADQIGNLDAHAQFGVDAGRVFDEDIFLSIAAVLANAGLNIYYLDGAAGNTRLTTEPGFSCKTTGTGRLAWNEWTGIIWKLTEVMNNKFVLYHVYATTEKDAPMVSIMGQAEYGNKSAAQAGALTEINDINLGNLPTPEFRPIATVIYQTSNAYGNAVQARIVSTDEGDDYIDWRTSTALRGTAISGCCSLDASYDRGDTIDYSTGNGPVVLNFPDGGTVDTIAEVLTGGNFNIRNLWVQANDGDSVTNVSGLFYTETDGNSADRHLLGIMSTDSGTNKYLRWEVSSLGLFRGTGFSVRNYITNTNAIHTISQAGAAFNLLETDIDLTVASLNNTNMLKVDAGNDSVGINTPTPSPHVELDVNGSLALRAGTVEIAEGQNNNVDIGENSFIRITGLMLNGLIGGFTDGADGRIIILVNTTGANLGIQDQSVLSLAANRIITGSGATITISGAGSCSLIYDATTARWRVFAHIA